MHGRPCLSPRRPRHLGCPAYAPPVIWGGRLYGHPGLSPRRPLRDSPGCWRWLPWWLGCGVLRVSLASFAYLRTKVSVRQEACGAAVAFPLLKPRSGGCPPVGQVVADLRVREPRAAAGGCGWGGLLQRRGGRWRGTRQRTEDSAISVTISVTRWDVESEGWHDSGGLHGLLLGQHTYRPGQRGHKGSGWTRKTGRRPKQPLTDKVSAGQGNPARGPSSAWLHQRHRQSAQH